jgi:hypothetical protein
MWRTTYPHLYPQPQNAGIEEENSSTFDHPNKAIEGRALRIGDGTHRHKVSQILCWGAARKNLFDLTDFYPPFAHTGFCILGEKRPEKSGGRAFPIEIT